MIKVLVGGCFNDIHPGHIYFLNEAKKLGDHLTVILTNDINNSKFYAVNYETRKRNIERLNVADTIIEGDKYDFSKTVRQSNPDIIVLGYDQSMPVGTVFFKKVVRLEKYKDYSSRNLHTKRRLFWEKEWYSICSLHFKQFHLCPYCQTGEWINRWGHLYNRMFFKYFPKNLVNMS